MRYLFTLCILLASLGTASAQTELAGLKIYINPGHGGHEPNDRNIVIYPFAQGDTLGYYESKSNLAKGLFLRNYLLDRGAEVKMSRTINRPEDDLPLSQISAEANAYNADLFYSIHSNAHNGQVNYPLMLFKGFDDKPVKPNDKKMAEINWNNFYSQKISTWTYDKQNVRGDWSFYGGGEGDGLGVLRGLNVEGFLSEGSFHDYIPETYRLMSSMYNKLEAWHFMKTIFDYFEKGEISTGNIAGDVRDSRNKLTASYYRVKGHDDLIPIHGAKITLTPGNIVVVTDNLYNGVYLFDQLAPGNYQMKVEAEGYYPQTVDVVVEKHKTTYEKILLNKVRDTAPVVLAYSPNVAEGDSVECSTPISIEFNWDMDEASTIAAFSINPKVEGTFSFEDSQHRMIFTPSVPLEISTVYTVTIDKSAKHPGEIAMGTDFSFKFLTKNRNRLALVQAYPADGDTTAYTKPFFRYVFDGELFTSNVAKGIKVLDKDGNILAKNVRSQEENSVDKPYGSAYFNLSKDLLENETYKVIISGEIKDVNNITVHDSIEINFRTKTTKITGETILDDFESTNLYAYDASASNDVTKASSARATAQKLFGTYSHSYTYTLANGAGTATYKAATPNMSVNTSEVMGLHIYGDFSANDLYLTFVDESGTENDIKLRNLDFLGWKFAEAKLSALPEGKSHKFAGFKVKGSNGVLSKSGTFYVDNLLLYGTPLGIDGNTSEAEVNIYPNPASDFVTVTIPDAEQLVSLDLFAINGSLVKSAKGNQMSVSELATGTYVLRVTTNNKVRSYPIIVKK